MDGGVAARFTFVALAPFALGLRAALPPFDDVTAVGVVDGSPWGLTEDDSDASASSVSFSDLPLDPRILFLGALTPGFLLLDASAVAWGNRTGIGRLSSTSIRYGLVDNPAGVLDDDFTAAVDTTGVSTQPIG